MGDLFLGNQDLSDINSISITTQLTVGAGLLVNATSYNIGSGSQNILINLKDNASSTLLMLEGANQYLSVSTNNGGEDFQVGVDSSTAPRILLLGGLLIRRIGTAVNYTALRSDTYIGVTNTAAPRTITLPASASVQGGKIYIIKDESGGAGTNNITIDGDGAETIDGAATKVINVNFGSATIITDGSNWFVI